MSTEQPTTEYLLSKVRKAIDEAREFGLDAEVILYAMKAIKEAPQISIEEALVAGLHEWDF